MTYLSAEQVLFIHARLIQETGGSQGVRDLGLLQSAIGRPRARFAGTDLYPDVFTKAAALIESLARNHPFIDGNKRTGIAAAGLFLMVNGHRLIASNEELASCALATAQGQLDLEQLTAWFRDFSEDINPQSS